MSRFVVTGYVRRVLSFVISQRIAFGYLARESTYIGLAMHLGCMGEQSFWIYK